MCMGGGEVGKGCGSGRHEEARGGRRRQAATQPATHLCVVVRQELRYQGLVPRQQVLERCKHVCMPTGGQAAGILSSGGWPLLAHTLPTMPTPPHQKNRILSSPPTHPPTRPPAPGAPPRRAVCSPEASGRTAARSPHRRTCAAGHIGGSRGSGQREARGEQMAVPSHGCQLALRNTPGSQPAPSVPYSPNPTPNRSHTQPPPAPPRACSTPTRQTA